MRREQFVVPAVAVVRPSKAGPVCWPPVNKQTSWPAGNIPNSFYGNSGTTGNHIPARIVVQRSVDANSATPRRFFVTGTSAGGTSADDWASMFSREQ